jgi:hypothetical protein
MLANKTFETVTKFKRQLTNPNCIQEEPESAMNSGNARYIHITIFWVTVSSLKTVILCGCKTWSLTIRGEHSLRLFENRVLRRIFRSKREEMAGGWRRLHNEELRNLCHSPNVIREIKSRSIRWAGHVACMGKLKNAYRILAGKPEGKGTLGRPRGRWEDNIRTNLREIKWLRLETSGRFLWTR